ncbi:mitochondrial carrier domain-containing protein, putative [Eimeria mitis]|uniref:Mitochondrial carrier domain-containing protein, putative n=1 Tax=Eimeria mitis TaxID=44415 RepID=U6K0U1_9EIME|nr:mitochondrial carrier domain-containing protein, putative [Eimeria mitis]CDJ31319.1 mitochondrial carrier domain-containing protein, putative [Eimeria mitis]
MSALTGSGNTKAEMLQHLLQSAGDTGELDISTCMQTVRKGDTSDDPQPGRDRETVYRPGAPFLIPSALSWEDRPKLAAGASGAAALLTCCALHPFDLIKTRMQVAAVTGGAIPLYGSTRSAITRIYKQEGLKGLWKGASGLVAGLFVTCLTHPLWLAKARMEMQAKEAEASGWPQFRNGFSCIMSTARGGVRESYKGIGPALALVPHAAIQIAVYERLKRKQ